MGTGVPGIADGLCLTDFRTGFGMVGLEAPCCELGMVLTGRVEFPIQDLAGSSFDPVQVRHSESPVQSE